jgi:hypothetical protein
LLSCCPGACCLPPSPSRSAVRRTLPGPGVPGTIKHCSSKLDANHNIVRVTSHIGIHYELILIHERSMCPMSL